MSEFRGWVMKCFSIIKSGETPWNWQRYSAELISLAGGLSHWQTEWMLKDNLVPLYSTSVAVKHGWDASFPHWQRLTHTMSSGESIVLFLMQSHGNKEILDWWCIRLTALWTSDRSTWFNGSVADSEVFHRAGIAGEIPPSLFLDFSFACEAEVIEEAVMV